MTCSHDVERRATVDRMRPHALASLRLVTVLGAALAVSTLLPRPAQACTCSNETPEAQFAAATSVFEGRVVAIEREGAPEVGPARLRVTFEVVQTWKAANVERLIVTTATDEAACGVAFAQGRSYVVYAIAGSDGALAAGLCGGTALRESADATVAALGAGVTPVDITDEAAPAPRTATPPGAGGCASCDVGAHCPAPRAPLALCGTLLAAMVIARRRR